MVVIINRDMTLIQHINQGTRGKITLNGMSAATKAYAVKVNDNDKAHTMQRLFHVEVQRAAACCDGNDDSRAPWVVSVCAQMCDLNSARRLPCEDTLESSTLLNHPPTCTASDQEAHLDEEQSASLASMSGLHKGSR